MIICYCSWDKVCGGFNYFSFWAISWPFTSLTAQKIKIKKKYEKIVWRHRYFAYVYQKLWLDGVWFLRYGVQQTARQTVGQKKCHIEVGASPNNYKLVKIPRSFKLLATLQSPLQVMHKLFFVNIVSFTLYFFIKTIFHKTMPLPLGL